MKKEKLLKTIFFFTTAFFLFTSYSIAACDTLNSTDPTCLPPTLGDLQTTIVSLIGTAYSMIGVIFLGILLFNGLIYLLGYLEDAKYILGASIEDAQKRMTQWLIGFMMVLISYPLVNGFMKGIVGTSDCYSNLNNPTVQFIFPEVCSIKAIVTKSDSPPEALSTPYGMLITSAYAESENLDRECRINVCGSTSTGYASGLYTSLITIKNLTLVCDCTTKKAYGTILPKTE